MKEALSDGLQNKSEDSFDSRHLALPIPACFLVEKENHVSYRVLLVSHMQTNITIMCYQMYLFMCRKYDRDLKFSGNVQQ